jgi:hypothetical protein
MWSEGRPMNQSHTTRGARSNAVHDANRFL